MLSLENTRYFQYTEKLIANDANATSIVEGSPLVLKIEDGLGKVGLPTGAATDKFVGVAFAGSVLWVWSTQIDRRRTARRWRNNGCKR